MMTQLSCDEIASALLSYRVSHQQQAIRSLSAADRAGVEDIGASTYGGHDYVADVFQQWLDHEGQGVVTAAIDDFEGRLAGFEVLTLYDGGKTGWLEALRVHPRCRGKGLATALQSHLVAVARDLLQLKRVRYTTATANIASRRLAAACGLQVVDSWAVIMPRRRVPPTTFAERVRAARARLAKRHGMKLDTGIHQRHVSPKELLSFAGGFGQRLLLQSYWKAYDFTLLNVEILLRSHQQPFVIEEDGASAGAKPLSSFSWAFHKQDAMGLTVFASVYTPDLHSTLAHITAQLEAAVAVGADAVVLMYPLGMELELHRLGLAERCTAHALDGTDEPNERIAKQVLVFERSFYQGGS
jgi:GNAT superfamily N-acetyltransferase